MVVDPRAALEPDAPLVRDDGNRVFDWEAGDAAATAAAFARADVVVEQEMLFPRVHPAPLETCGAVADYDRVSGKLTVWCTTQAPHAHRTLYSLITGLPEHKIRVISPDVGGGFGNKVPIYPGYLCAVVGALNLGRPVKWVEDRSENLMSTGFARDYAMTGRIAATRDGRILAVAVDVIADHGAFNAAAQPTTFPAGFFSVFTGSYDVEAAHCRVTGAYTNKAPGGVAYSCSFRIAEAVYLIERTVDCLARELEIDPVELRLRNLLRADQFPYRSKTGWVYDSGDYERTLRRALELADYDGLRREQAERRERGELMGIGVSFFTEAVGAGPRKHMDILGLAMNDGASLRISPTGTAQLAISVQTQGQGHETTFAQIVSHGARASRSRRRRGRARRHRHDAVRDGHLRLALDAGERRRHRAGGAQGARAGAAGRERDARGRAGGPRVGGRPLVGARRSRRSGASLREIAAAARGPVELPPGVEAGLDAEAVYDPPNLTFPFGAYVCVVDVDPGTAAVKVRRFVAVDDCGVRINPMIVEGQIHGGLTDGVGMALMEQIAFDEDGNCLGGSLMDYLIPDRGGSPGVGDGFHCHTFTSPSARREGCR